HTQVDPVPGHPAAERHGPPDQGSGPRGARSHPAHRARSRSRDLRSAAAGGTDRLLRRFHPYVALETATDEEPPCRPAPAKDSPPGSTTLARNSNRPRISTRRSSGGSSPPGPRLRPLQPDPEKLGRRPRSHGARPV